jgi:hypothetical protein
MRGFVAAMMVLASTAAGAAAPQTITGELVDVRCALQDANNVGDGHVDCALSCAKRGATLGILTDDGVYTIAGEYTGDNNKRLIEFVGRTVEATGDISERRDVRVITVTSIHEAR